MLKFGAIGVNSWPRLTVALLVTSQTSPPGVVSHTFTAARLSTLFLPEHCARLFCRACVCNHLLKSRFLLGMLTQLIGGFFFFIVLDSWGSSHLYFHSFSTFNNCHPYPTIPDAVEVCIPKKGVGYMSRLLYSFLGSIFSHATLESS